MRQVMILRSPTVVCHLNQQCRKSSLSPLVINLTTSQDDTNTYHHTLPPIHFPQTGFTARLSRCADLVTGFSEPLFSLSRDTAAPSSMTNCFSNSVENDGRRRRRRCLALDADTSIDIAELAERNAPLKFTYPAACGVIQAAAVDGRS